MAHSGRMYTMKGSVCLLLVLFTAVAAVDIPFSPPKDIAEGEVLGISSMDAGDIDGDERIDVVVIEGGKHAGGRKTFAWFQAPKDSQQRWQRFDFNPNVPLRPFLGAAKLTDIDSDGDLDLIVSSDHHSGNRPTKETSRQNRCEYRSVIQPHN